MYRIAVTVYGHYLGYSNIVLIITLLKLIQHVADMLHNLT